VKPAFRELDDESPSHRVQVTFDGQVLSLPMGENLAAALLAAGIRTFRQTPVSGAPRAPYCMMGACYDCLIEVEGITRQACMMQVSEGLILRRPDRESKDA
jgi:predicted molibdopterin-dependent oxidoreductase YjgC